MCKIENFAELVKERGTDSLTKDKVFLMYRDADEKIYNVTYSEFYREALKYGALLRGIRREKGLEQARRFHIGTYMQNIPEFLYLLAGCAFSGSTLVGINSAQVGERLKVDIDRMDVEALFVDDAVARAGETFIERVMEAKRKYGFERVSDSDIFLVSDKYSKLPSGAKLLTAEIAKFESLEVQQLEVQRLDENATGIIIFTSGTTGAPKGIEVSWKKLIDAGFTAVKLLDYRESDIGYVCMPLIHSNSLYLNVMPAILTSAKIGLRRRFSSSNFVRDLEEYQTTIWNCVGDPVQYVLNVVGDKDYSYLPLRKVISTGTPPDNREKFSKIFGLEEFKEVYGSTEAGAITGVTPEAPRYTVGKLLRDVKVVSEDNFDKECERAVIIEGRIKNFEKAVGEIVVSQDSLGSSKFAGYYGLPEESAKRVDKNNYFHMGDLGAIVEDASGQKYLIFLGRLGDWIRSKGENWSAVDIENIIIKHKEVKLAAVIGIPQASGREDDPMYILEVSEPSEFDAQAFYEWCTKELSHFALPRFIRVVKALPQTDTIKTQKTLLRQEFFMRTQEMDNNPNDILFEVTGGKVKIFTREDYHRELANYKDPVARDRLVIFTNRRLFEA